MFNFASISVCLVFFFLVYIKQWNHGKKKCFCASLSKNFCHFFDDRKFFGSVLKRSVAKYNFEKHFEFHLPVVLTGALVVAGSGPKQKAKRTNDKDEPLLI